VDYKELTFEQFAAAMRSIKFIKATRAPSQKLDTTLATKVAVEGEEEEEGEGGEEAGDEDSDRDALRLLFDCFDDDGNGSIDMHELLVHMAVFSEGGSTQQRLQLIFTAFDADHSGALELAEFKLMVRALLASKHGKSWSKEQAENYAASLF
jgi:hypothetical protein